MFIQHMFLRQKKKPEQQKKPQQSTPARFQYCSVACYLWTLPSVRHHLAPLGAKEPDQKLKNSIIEIQAMTVPQAPSATGPSSRG